MPEPQYLLHGSQYSRYCRAGSVAAWQRGYKVHANVANIAKMGANIANIDVSMCQCVDVSMCRCVDVPMYQYVV